MVTIKQATAFHFYHGDFGWYGDADDVWWDGEGGVEPGHEDIDAAMAYWDEEGLNEALRDYEDGYADYMEHM